MKEKLINRVPHIIFLYWVIKIASTTLGETGADMFSMTFDLGYGSTIVIFMSLFLAFLGMKLYIKKYDTLLYWLVFTTTAIVGTAISDYIDRSLGLGYTLGSFLLIVSLFLVLGVWYLKEKTIAVENITTQNAEIFYWSAFLVANTLGTAAGDFLADELNIGFLNSALIISALLAVTALLHFYTKVSSLVLFWIAFVLTRPFGATFGDLLTKAHDQGGLGIGIIGASIFFTVVLIIAMREEIKIEKRKKINDYTI